MKKKLLFLVLSVALFSKYLMSAETVSLIALYFLIFPIVYVVGQTAFKYFGIEEN